LICYDIFIYIILFILYYNKAKKHIFYIHMFYSRIESRDSSQFSARIKIEKNWGQFSTFSKKHISIHDFMLEEPCLQRIEVLK